MAYDSQSVYEECLGNLLRPIVRFCIRRSIPVQFFIELGKTLYLEAAAVEMKSQGEKVNVSRLSVSTGLHRRDVVRLCREDAAPRPTKSLTSRIIGQWEHDSRFTTKAGRPRVLSFEGENSEFRQLVSLVSSDVNPGTLLFELDRIKAVERTKKGLRLCASRHVIVEDPKESFALLEQDAHDLICAVSENVFSSTETKHLHARTEFDNICPDDLAQIKRWVLKEGSAFHAKIRKYLARFDQDINPRLAKTGGAKVTVGTFSICESGDHETR